MSGCHHALLFNGQLYKIEADFAALLEIESEVGSLRAFSARLHNSTWTIGELVTAAHVLLNRARCECDYMQLGHDMVASGLERYRASVARLIAAVLDEDEGA